MLGSPGGGLVPYNFDTPHQAKWMTGGDPSMSVVSADALKKTSLVLPPLLYTRSHVNKSKEKTHFDQQTQHITTTKFSSLTSTESKENLHVDHGSEVIGEARSIPLGREKTDFDQEVAPRSGNDTIAHHEKRAQEYIDKMNEKINMIAQEIERNVTRTAQKASEQNSGGSTPHKRSVVVKRGGYVRGSGKGGSNWREGHKKS